MFNISLINSRKCAQPLTQYLVALRQQQSVQSTYQQCYSTEATQTEQEQQEQLKQEPPKQDKKQTSSSRFGLWVGLAGVMGVGGIAWYFGLHQSLLSGGKEAESTVGNYDAVREAIANILEVENYDDGSYGPLLVRLAWHCSGTYDKTSKTGGSDGARMRYPPEKDDPANNGLDIARKILEPIKKKFSWISYADLYTLSGVVAIEEMGGPKISWRPGRKDVSKPPYEKIDKIEYSAVPEGRLPDGGKDQRHIRKIFYRMGFNDQEIVALSGAHTLGRCHADRSGWINRWTNAPTTFSNLYFQELMNVSKWKKKKWDGPTQYEDPTGELMMLPTDMALIWDRKFKKYVEIYANDEEKFFKDFADAFAKLLELGVTFTEPTPTAAATS